MSYNEVTQQLLSLQAYPRLRGVTFDQLIGILDDRISFHVTKHRGKLRGLDDDDIRQELLIALWRALPKIPEDIIWVDYRFTRYMDTVWNRSIAELHRSRLVQYRPGEWRDAADRSITLTCIEDVLSETGEIQIVITTDELTPSLDL